MSNFDVVFVGYLGSYTVVPFTGCSVSESGGPAFHCSMTASRLACRVGTVTRFSDSEAHLLELLKQSDVHLFAERRQTPFYRAVFPTANVDDRKVFLDRRADPFGIDDVPPIAPCLIHLAGWHIREFSLEFMKELKARGFLVSVDMQSFVFQEEHETGRLYLQDVPEKKEILSTADFAKLDSAEAEVLTGTDDVQDQAKLLEGWGSKETVITFSEGALVRSNGKTTIARFTNKSNIGRMGRGDTVMSSYLAHRFNHSVEGSIRFAAALTSIKLESTGPFKGSIQDVMARINGHDG